MEDPNMLAADCIVITCCCQCMILQILVFVLLKLPCKLVKKTKEYTKRFRNQKRREKIVQIEIRRYGEDSFRSHGNSFRIQTDKSLGFNCCMDEIDHVLEDFSNRGEFAFGSFWGGEISRRFSTSCLNEEELDYEVVQCHLIEIFGCVNLP
ncbi:uncharacterized protein LOC111398954 [Olea europaea var. sylvestris]|uniref:uncharacterized protein LOC111398954 n=1 Tax=Olea europaea var. sylvestris TaxID=158386 RepID=UPI000C1D151D|nr:uncharacterized protein LOC111398954 [Olea europaea var. sylvestris]